MKKVYLAGSISGLEVTTATGWRRDAIRKLKDHDIAGYSPMRGTAYVSGTQQLSEEEKKKFFAQDIDSIVGINVRDYNDCKTADAILVNFLNSEKVSIGTVMEIAWARAFQIPVVIVMDKTNIHNHGMLTFGAIIENSIEDGLIAIIQLLNP